MSCKKDFSNDSSKSSHCLNSAQEPATKAQAIFFHITGDRKAYFSSRQHIAPSEKMLSEKAFFYFLGIDFKIKAKFRLFLPPLI